MRAPCWLTVSVSICLALAVQYQGREITTIEGIAAADQLHPLQAAFIEYDGFQCGYCTPGHICSAIGMVEEYKQGMPSAVTKISPQPTSSFPRRRSKSA